jgi:IclR family transcriptional regulator, acetate operon repressor
MGRDGRSVIEKAATVLEHFVDAAQPAQSFNQLLAGGGLSKATTHRLLAEMVKHGLLSQHARRDEYTLGPLARSLGVLAARDSTVRSIALPEMERLRDACGETIVLAELHGDSVVPVSRVEGLSDLRMQQEIGKRYPAYAGATGKVLLASISAADRDAYLKRVRLEPLTDRTQTSAEDLRREVEAAEQLGVWVTRGERVREAVGISAPIYDGDGELVAAMTISGVATHFDMERLIKAVILDKEAVVRVSSELGYREPDERLAALKSPTSPEHQQLIDVCRHAWERAGERLAEVS